MSYLKLFRVGGGVGIKVTIGLTQSILAGTGTELGKKKYFYLNIEIKLKSYNISLV